MLQFNVLSFGGPDFTKNIGKQIWKRVTKLGYLTLILNKLSVKPFLLWWSMNCYQTVIEDWKNFLSFWYLLCFSWWAKKATVCFLSLWVWDVLSLLRSNMGLCLGDEGEWFVAKEAVYCLSEKSWTEKH